MNKFHHLTALCIIMPYIGYGGMPTDVQPLALLFSTISLILLVANKTIVLNRLTVPLLLALFLAIAGFFLGTPLSQRNLFYDSRALYGYISSVVVFTVFFNYISNVSSVALRRITDAVVLLIFIGFALNLAGLTWIIQLFVARAEFGFFEDQNRGLTSFFPEQSRLANQMLLLIALYYAASSLTKWRLLLVVLLAVASASGQFFINFSVLVASFVVSSLFALQISQQARLKISVSVSLVVLLSSVFAYHVLFFADDLVAVGFPARGIYAFREVLHFDLHSLGDDYGFLFKVSGPLQGYASTYTSPVSLELGASYYFTDNAACVRVYEDTLSYIFQATRAPYPERAYSILGAWVTDLKLFGVMLVVLFAMALKSSVKKATGNERVATSALVLVTLFLFLTRSNTSDPTFWATTATVYATVDARRIARRASQCHAMKFSVRSPIGHRVAA